ncbi:hypothetical protein B0H13DRAFT_2088735 [Mycena leptocephala]|nr:hypothetical protein B0H13DRAFT_2088735 [Mycena leptocephala]
MSPRTPVLTICYLPNELLAAVVVAGQEEPVADSQPRAFNPEWTLSHVCRRFRDLIVGSPTLWTIIYADFETEGSMKIFRLYLERSGACNVSATLRGSRRLLDEYDLPAERSRFSQIVPYVNRIWRLRVVLSTEWGREVLACFRDATAPNLQHLEIINYPPGFNDDRSTVEMFSSGAPRLKFLKMDGMKLLVPPAIQWAASLTHVELLGGQRADNLDSHSLLVAITTQCPLLVHLHLDLSWTLILPARRFHIPTLKLLHLLIYDSADELFLLHMVDLFDTPVLTEFIIHSTHGDQLFVLFNATSLPRSSFSALTSFSFINRDSCSCERDDELSDTISSPPLALFPALSSLTLVNQCFTSNFVRDILGPSSQPWPRLKTVTLCPNKDTYDAVRDTLKDVVDSKRQNGQPLPKLRLFRALSTLEAWQENAWQGNRADVEVFL